MNTFQQKAPARLSAVNPVPPGSASSLVPRAWREELLEGIAAETPSSPPSRHRPQRRLRLVVVAAVALALLAVPSYGLARAMIDWVRGEPAPPAVVQDFESYTPQLGYQPDPGGAILVAVDGGVRLYSTKNDKGSYCLVLTAPGRPSGDGGTCIKPAWAAEPLIVGTLGAVASDERSSTHFIGGRSNHPEARSIRFTDPNGRTIVRPIGFDGFFVASVHLPSSTCGDGDWRPMFSVLDASGNEVERAAITLLFSYPGQAACSYVPPHPPSVR
jgi:hypothetical protein